MRPRPGHRAYSDLSADIHDIADWPDARLAQVLRRHLKVCAELEIALASRSGRRKDKILRRVSREDITATLQMIRSGASALASEVERRAAS